MDDDFSVGIEQTYKNEKLLRFISFVLGCLLTIGILCISSKYNNYFTLTIKKTSSYRFINETLYDITGEGNDLRTKWEVEREYRRKIKEIEDGILEGYRGKQEKLKQEYDEKVRSLKLEKKTLSNQLKIFSIEFDKEKLKLDTEKREIFERYKKENNDVKNDVEKQIKELKQERMRLKQEKITGMYYAGGTEGIDWKNIEKLKKQIADVTLKILEQPSIRISSGFKFARNKRVTRKSYIEKLEELKRKYKLKEDKLDYKTENLFRKLKREFDESKEDLRIKKRQQLKSGKLKILVLEQNKEVDRLIKIENKKRNFRYKLSYVFWFWFCVGGFEL